jgi:hypothetical protein
MAVYNYYVNGADGSDLNNGTSWDYPKKTIFGCNPTDRLRPRRQNDTLRNNTRFLRVERRCL